MSSTPENEGGQQGMESVWDEIRGMDEEVVISEEDFAKIVDGVARMADIQRIGYERMQAIQAGWSKCLLTS